MSIRNYICILLLFPLGLRAQLCSPSDYPAPISDSCGLAPLFCGNYLDGYCSSNIGMTDDNFGQKTGFLRFAPCETTVQLLATTGDCSGEGLIFTLYTEGCNAVQALFRDTILAQSSGVLEFNGLQPLENYMLVVSGLNGSECTFRLQVVSGIGTALPGVATCSCTSGGIQGPLQICSYESVNYELFPPSCSFTFGLPQGGNGEYCPPPNACPGALDSVVLIWHIPDVMHFVGDSTGLEVEIALNNNYSGLDTLRADSVWVTWMLVSTNPIDSLAYCECQGVSCNSFQLVLPISIGFTHEYIFGEITCVQPTCVIDGQTYNAPGDYVNTIGCLQIHHVVLDNTIPPDTPDVSDQTICEGAVATLNVWNVFPSYTYVWNTGAGGSVITVAPIQTTSYTVTVINMDNGCTNSVMATVTVLPLQEFFLPLITLCPGECYDFFGQPICVDTTLVWTEGCDTYHQQIKIGPSLSSNFGVVGFISCSNPCFTYLGNVYCNPGIYVHQINACTADTFEIQFQKEIIQLGVVGTLDCQHLCVPFGLQDYCQAGAYQIEDDCRIQYFTIAQNIDLPVCSTPFPDCEPNNTHFTVAFNISGQPPFKVDGVPIAGNYFLSDIMPNGTPYAFVVEQANGCQAVVSGIYDCSAFCLTDAGKLSGELLQGCAAPDQAVQVEITEPPTLEAGDVIDFSLLDADGQLITHNNSGVFSFDPSLMEVEVTYFIVCSAGAPDTTGLPDPNNACTDTSSSQPLVFHQAPQVMISGDSVVCAGENLLLDASGATTYTWSNGATGQTITLEMLDQAGWYSVIGEDANGCTGKDSISVAVLDEDEPPCCNIYWPNAFTPNGDGSNDSFAPLLPGCNIEFLEMRVYARWGELVYRGNKPDSRWDGHWPGGAEAASDTYVYTFTYKLEGNKEITRKGEVTLLR